MKQNIYQLEIRVRESHEELRKAKSELNSMYSERERKCSDKENYAFNQGAY